MPEIAVNPTRVILVDDHEFVRNGVRAVLSSEEDIEVVGEAGSGREAVDVVQSLMPDVVVMDINMPGMDGLEATRLIKMTCPSVSVIVLTVNDAELFLVEAIKAGAGSYLLKDSSSELLVRSIRALANGGSMIPLHLLQKAMESEPRGGDLSHIDGEMEALTEKEMEVLVRIVRGMKNQEIADELNVAKVTVKKRVQSLLAKLYVSDRTQAALKAVKLGLVDL